MDKNNNITEHRKGQHLTAEERHLIEVRYNYDKESISRIAKELNRPYNTIKNEIQRGIVFLYHGTVKRYKTDIGYQEYLKHRRESSRKYKVLEAAKFLQYVVEHFREDKWSLDVCAGRALMGEQYSKKRDRLYENTLSLC